MPNTSNYSDNPRVIRSSNLTYASTLPALMQFDFFIEELALQAGQSEIFIEDLKYLKKFINNIPVQDIPVEQVKIINCFKRTLDALVNIVELNEGFDTVEGREQFINFHNPDDENRNYIVPVKHVQAGIQRDLFNALKSMGEAYKKPTQENVQNIVTSYDDILYKVNSGLEEASKFTIKKALRAIGAFVLIALSAIFALPVITMPIAAYGLTVGLAELNSVRQTFHYAEMKETLSELRKPPQDVSPKSDDSNSGPSPSPSP